MREDHKVELYIHTQKDCLAERKDDPKAKWQFKEGWNFTVLTEWYNNKFDTQFSVGAVTNYINKAFPGGIYAPSIAQLSKLAKEEREREKEAREKELAERVDNIIRSAERSEEAHTSIFAQLELSLADIRLDIMTIATQVGVNADRLETAKHKS
jgi:hypothetical protein